MSNFKSVQFNLNRFFKEIHLKKQYLKKIQNKAYVLRQLKEISYKQLNSQFLIEPSFLQDTTCVMHVIDISFSKKNTLFHVSDFLGNVKFFYSAGSFQQKGKGKAARSMVLRQFYKLLVSKFKFVRKVPLAFHFKNADFNISWFLKKLKKKFFVRIVKHFTYYSYNGCRKRKIRRKKFKKRSLVI